MPRSVRKKLTGWDKASPAAFIGLVEAPDKQTAFELAIPQFKVRPVDESRLLGRPH